MGTYQERVSQVGGEYLGWKMKLKMKSLVFICRRSIVLGPMARALFEHMGPSLINWEASCVGLHNQAGSKVSDSGKVSDILQNYAVPYKEKRPTLLTERDIRNATLVICFEKKDYDTIKHDYDHTNLINIQMLGYYHPNGPIDIPDPLNFSDPKGYDKCYWMIYKSVKNLVKLLKEEEEIESRRKPKIVKLADPTIFTITSPSSWQKNKLKSPDIPVATLCEPLTPSILLLVPLPGRVPSPPQEPLPEVTDSINCPDKYPKELIELTYANPNIEVIFPPFEDFEDLDFQTCVDITPSPPQPPLIDLEDTINEQSLNPVNKSLNHLLPPMLTFYPLNVPTQFGETPVDLLSISPPQPPSVYLSDEPNELFIIAKLIEEIVVPKLEFHLPEHGIDCSHTLSCHLSPPPASHPTDEIDDKINKLDILYKKLVDDESAPNLLQLPLPLTAPEDPIQLKCNVRLPGRKPIHPRHQVSCTHLHILISCIFTMAPPPLDLEHVENCKPVTRRRGDIFDDVKHYRSFMK